MHGPIVVVQTASKGNVLLNCLLWEEVHFKLKIRFSRRSSKNEWHNHWNDDFWNPVAENIAMCQSKYVFLIHQKLFQDHLHHRHRI